MSASDSLLSSSEQTSTPKTHKIGTDSDTKFSKVTDSKTAQQQVSRFQDSENVNVTPSKKLNVLTKLEPYRNDSFRKYVRLV